MRRVAKQTLKSSASSLLYSKNAEQFDYSVTHLTLILAYLHQEMIQVKCTLNQKEAFKISSLKLCFPTKFRERT